MTTSHTNSPKLHALSDLHGSLADPALDSMNFLNEVAGKYPDAFSFAAGRPIEDFFEPSLITDYLHRYERYLVEEKHYTPEQVRREYFQYGRTKGLIHELIARNLAMDEGITIAPDAIVVTTGCQEAMLLVLRALRRDENDVVLAVAPTYVGLTGAARLVDMPVLPVDGGPTGIDLEHLRTVIHEARQAGQRPRACYLLPDCSNPTGISLDIETRHALLELAEQEDILLLEDNPYGLFGMSDVRLPTLKALDTRRRVVYLGSFAKTALPGARVGYVVADQLVYDVQRGTSLFADELGKLKSMVTVNTSPISQAVVAGKLLTYDCSLIRANEREAAVYRGNLQRLLAGLEGHFRQDVDNPVRWNTPGGGFFLVLTVPFEADDKLLEVSAREFGVLWTPMRHFYDAPEAYHQIRLSFSLLTPDEIDAGLERLAAFIHAHAT